jgi:hypothetical protein
MTQGALETHANVMPEQGRVQTERACQTSRTFAMMRVRFSKAARQELKKLT